jgi:glutathione S-transferase
MTLKLYTAALSLFSRKVEIALYEKGLPFEREFVAFTQEQGYSPKHPVVLAANPKGQVPVLVDGDLTLFDSTVILEYLEDTHPAPPLYPADAQARARCRVLELYGDEILLKPVARLMYRTEPPLADLERQRALQEEGGRAEAELPALYGALERELGEREFFCDTLSAADLALFMTLHWGLRLRGPTLDGQPRLAAWYARMRARPSVARAVEEIAAADRELSSPLAP